MGEVYALYEAARARLCHPKTEERAVQKRDVLMNIREKEGLAFWFEKKHPDHEWNTSKGRYEEVDNLLRYPFLSTPSKVRRS